jgi:hypothetical protein
MSLQALQAFQDWYNRRLRRFDLRRLRVRIWFEPEAPEAPEVKAADTGAAEKQFWLYVKDQTGRLLESHGRRATLRDLDTMTAGGVYVTLLGWRFPVTSVDYPPDWAPQIVTVNVYDAEFEQTRMQALAEDRVEGPTFARRDKDGNPTIRPERAQGWASMDDFLEDYEATEQRRMRGVRGDMP